MSDEPDDMEKLAPICALAKAKLNGQPIKADPVALSAWLQSRPLEVQAMATRFPPLCFVRATKPLVVPGPGKLGVVVSYTERKDGSVGLRVFGETQLGGAGFLAAECDPTWVEVAS